MAATTRHFRELDVYQLAMEATMEIFEMTKSFPPKEKYSLTDQVKRSYARCAPILPKPGANDVK